MPSDLRVEQLLQNRFGVLHSNSPDALHIIKQQEIDVIYTAGIKDAEPSIKELAQDLISFEKSSLSKLGLGYEQLISIPKRIQTAEEIVGKGFNLNGHSSLDRILIRENGVHLQPFYGVNERLKVIWQSLLLAHELKHFMAPFISDGSGNQLSPQTQIIEEGIANHFGNNSWDIISKHFPEESEAYAAVIAESGLDIHTHRIEGCFQFGNGDRMQIGRIEYSSTSKLFNRLLEADNNFLTTVEKTRFTGDSTELRLLLTSIFRDDQIFTIFQSSTTWGMNQIAEILLGKLVR